jgi:hypothetical protein
VFIYRTTWGNYTYGDADQFIGRRPLGTFLPDNGINDWSAIDLRQGALADRCLLGTQVELPSTPIGTRLIATSADDQLSVIQTNLLGNELDLTLETDADSRIIKNLILNLLTIHADPVTRWPELKPTFEGRLQVWLAGELLTERAVPQGGAYTDNFNRASLGGAWTAGLINGPLAIEASTVLANTQDNTAFHVARYDTDLPSANHYVEADALSGTDRAVGLTARHTSSDQSCYLGEINGGTGAWEIYEADTSGNFSNLSSVAGTTAPGRMRFEANGSSLTFKVDGVTKATTTDSTLSGLRAGASFFGNLGNLWRIDNWQADAVTGPADPPNLTVIVTGTTVALDWDASGAAGLVDYKVFRRTPPTGVAFNPNSDTPIATGITATNYDDTGRSVDTMYEYQVFGRTVT